MPVTLTDIDVGSGPDVGDGDPARTAFQAINANNTELETKVLDETEVDARVTTISPPDKYLGQNLKTASYELILTDAGKLIEIDNASANNLTIPANASVAFPVDTRIDIFQYGAGQTTILITTDTLRGDVKIAAQYGMVSLWKRAATEWVVVGGVA